MRKKSGKPVYRMKDITVVTPYKAMHNRLQQAIRRRFGHDARYVHIYDEETFASEKFADVKTIDSFQGGENRAIIMPFVVKNQWQDIGFNADMHRLLVALTRAKDRLILIGDFGWDANNGSFNGTLTNASCHVKRGIQDPSKRRSLIKRKIEAEAAAQVYRGIFQYWLNLHRQHFRKDPVTGKPVRPGADAKAAATGGTLTEEIATDLTKESPKALGDNKGRERRGGRRRPSRKQRRRGRSRGDGSDRGGSKSSSGGNSNTDLRLDRSKSLPLLIGAFLIAAGCVNNEPDRGILGPLTFEETEEYISYLESDPKDVYEVNRYYACLRLAGAKPWADKVLPKLRRALLRDPSWRVRAKAVIAISKITTLTEKDIRSLVDIINNKELQIEIRIGVADELSTIGIPDMPDKVSSMLNSILEDKNESNVLRLVIADILGYNNVDKTLMLGMLGSLREDGYKSFLALERLNWLRRNDKRRHVRRAAKSTAREILRDIERKRREEEQKQQELMQSRIGQAA